MLRLILILILMLSSIGLMPMARAAESLATRTNIPLCFTPALLKWQETAGFREAEPGTLSTEWRPHLQLLVGVTAVDGDKRTVHLVELTTLPLAATNSAGSPGQPSLRTNHWVWAATNKAQFITTNYPVRVRVFDASGQLLKEGQTPMAWGMVTNGLLDLCRIGFETYGVGANATNVGPKPQEVAPLMLATGGGFLWMMGMFGDLQTVPTVADVWGQAKCAIRWPSAWALAKSLFTGFSITLAPQVEKISLAPPSDPTVPLYRLPVELRNGGRCLCQVEIIVGPAQGAEMLLAGVQSIRAQHPTKPKQEFQAQVIAAGSIASP